MGVAQDLYLFKNGKQLNDVNGDVQCSSKPEDLAKLAEIMYAADPQFKRLEFESWHFEFGTPQDPCHVRTTAVPKCCSDKTCRTNPTGYCSKGR
jgi:hypothetical protein